MNKKKKVVRNKNLQQLHQVLNLTTADNNVGYEKEITMMKKRIWWWWNGTADDDEGKNETMVKILKKNTKKQEKKPEKRFKKPAQKRMHPGEKQFVRMSPSFFAKTPEALFAPYRHGMMEMIFSCQSAMWDEQRNVSLAGSEMKTPPFSVFLPPCPSFWESEKNLPAFGQNKCAYF